EAMARLQAAAGGLNNVRIWDESIAHSHLMALVSRSDVLLSLHRAEGFGLALAEAMHLGAPTVATGWSGNREFMSDRNGFLIDHDFVAVRDPQGLYGSGQVWAEPRIDDAATTLRLLRSEPARGSVRAAAARLDVLTLQERFNQA